MYILIRQLKKINVIKTVKRVKMKKFVFIIPVEDKEVSETETGRGEAA